MDEKKKEEEEARNSSSRVPPPVYLETPSLTLSFFLSPLFSFFLFLPFVLLSFFLPVCELLYLLLYVHHPVEAVRACRRGTETPRTKEKKDESSDEETPAFKGVAEEEGGF